MPLRRRAAQAAQEHLQRASEVYKEDGHPNVTMIVNKSGLRLCAYKWPATTPEGTEVIEPRAAILLVHGVTSWAKFEYLFHPQCRLAEEVWWKKKEAKLKQLGPGVDESTVSVDLAKDEFPPLNEKEYKGQYADSWVERFSRAGYEVFSVDLQGHGLSDGWEGARCAVERFDDFADDVIQILNRIREIRSRPLPVFMLGISMGGLVAARALELACQRRTIGPENEDLTAVVLLAPALSLAQVKAKPINQIALPFAKALSTVLPHLNVADKQPNKKYAHIDQLCAFDPLVFKGKLEARLATEMMDKIDEAHNDAKTVNRGIKVLLVHSKLDTMCDCEGSQRMHKELAGSTLWLLDDMWHFLTMEPGNEALQYRILDWLEEVMKSTACC